MERLLELVVNEDGTVLEEVEIICGMTGFRTKYMILYLGEGVWRSVEVGAC